MSEEILINVTPPETRVAVVENGVVQELIIERTAKRGLVGNIYKGKVCRVLPGMQAAFVDAGLERAAFLHASDIRAGEAEHSGQITDLVREGGEVIVQVVKDPLGTKGARLTTNISIPSRFMVFMPNVSNVGVSQKIEDENERARLRDVLTQYAEANNISAGFIARTAADGVSEEALHNDMRFLVRLWKSIHERAANTSGKQLIHEDLPLALRALRDLINPEVEKVRVDSRSTWEKAQQFATKYIPNNTPRSRTTRAKDRFSTCTVWGTRSRKRSSARSSSNPAAIW